MEIGLRKSRITNIANESYSTFYCFIGITITVSLGKWASLNAFVVRQMRLILNKHIDDFLIASAYVRYAIILEMKVLVCVCVCVFRVVWKIDRLRRCVFYRVSLEGMSNRSLMSGMFKMWYGCDLICLMSWVNAGYRKEFRYLSMDFYFLGILFSMQVGMSPVIDRCTSLSFEKTAHLV